MRHKLYVGNIEALRGLAALVQIEDGNPRQCIAQFDRNALGVLPFRYDLNWHPFLTEEFEDLKSPVVPERVKGVAAVEAGLCPCGCGCTLEEIREMKRQ